jgi:hypothetical protein
MFIVASNIYFLGFIFKKMVVWRNGHVMKEGVSSKKICIRLITTINVQPIYKVRDEFFF